jgi:hypothetical protein
MPAHPPGLHQAVQGIERELGDVPIKALDDPRARSIFLEWRDRLAHTSLRQADCVYGTLARVLSWAYDRGLIAKTRSVRFATSRLTH